MTTQNDIELRWMAEVIFRRFWVVLVCGLSAALIGLTVSFISPLTYRASAKLMIEPWKNTKSNEFDTLAAAERMAYTYSQMMKNTSVVSAAIEKTGAPVTVEALTKKIIAEPIIDTHLVLLTVTHSSPETAATLANALAEAFIKYNQAMQTNQYTSLLADNQEKMDSLQALIQGAQNEIDTLSVERSEEQSKLNELKEGQSDRKSELRQLQNNLKELQQKIQRLESHVTIAEFAQPSQASRATATRFVTVTLLINQNPVIEGNDYSSILAGEKLASTYGQILVSRPVVEAALQNIGSQQRFEDIQNNLRVSIVPGTLLIKLEVYDNDAVRASALANAIAQEFISQNKSQYQVIYNDQISKIESQIEETSSLIATVEAEISSLNSSIIQANTKISRAESLVYGYQNDLRSLEQNKENICLEMDKAAGSIMLVEAASLPKAPMQNRPLTVILAGLVGGMIGVAAVFLLQYFDNKIRTPEDVRALLGLKVLGVIGRLDKNDPQLLIKAHPNLHLKEQFSFLSTRIRRSLSKDPMQHNILIISSPTDSEGKSFISANLAVAAANEGLRVVLIDADLRHPSIHRIFKVKESRGVADISKGNLADIDLLSTEISGLHLLVGGRENGNPAQLFHSPHIKSLFTYLKQHADLIIVDCPPILFFADTQILGSYANGILMVLRSGKTWNKAALDAKEVLEQIGVNLLGVVLNDTPNTPDNSYYYYGYGSQKKGRISQGKPEEKTEGILYKAMVQKRYPGGDGDAQV